MLLGRPQAHRGKRLPSVKTTARRCTSQLRSPVGAREELTRGSRSNPHPRARCPGEAIPPSVDVVAADFLSHPLAVGKVLQR